MSSAKWLTVVGVLRNQNLDLWQKYTLVRTAIAHECTRQDVHFESVSVASSAAFFPPLDPSCNEWRLSHGTGAAGARDICAQNFRLNLAGTGATWKEAGKGKGVPLYGFGLYMAERITKADEYSKSGEKDYEGIFQVILCRVAGGRTNIVQDNEINREKLSELVFDGPHHSVLGDRVTKLGKPFRNCSLRQGSDLPRVHHLVCSQVDPNLRQARDVSAEEVEKGHLVELTHSMRRKLSQPVRLLRHRQGMVNSNEASASELVACACGAETAGQRPRLRCDGEIGSSLHV